MDLSLNLFINNIKQKNMKPSTPSKYVWIIGLILGILCIKG